MSRPRIIASIACFTALVTFVLITWGGLVFNTDSSLACPDWPMCFNTFFPEMTGGVFFEHTHRILGTLAGVCSIALLGLMWRRGDDQIPSRRALGVSLLGLVIFQGVLGGLIVLMHLPPLVRMAHLGTSMIFFMFVIYTSRTSLARLRAGRGALLPANARFHTDEARLAARLLFFAGVAVYLQILFGALIRHTGATYALQLGWAGSVVPVDPATHEAMLWPGEVAARAQALHRYLAPAIAMYVAAAGARAWLAAKRSGRAVLARWTWLPLGVVLAQVGVGVAMIGTMLEVALRTAHLALAALLLASLYWLYLEFRAQAAVQTASDASDAVPISLARNASPAAARRTHAAQAGKA